MISSLRQWIQNQRIKRIIKSWHRSATIGDHFEIDGGASIWNESMDPSKVTIGHHARVTRATIVCKSNAKVRIGDYSVLQDRVAIQCALGISIGNYVGIASGTIVSDNNTHALGTENWIRHRITVAPGGPGYPGLGNGWELSDSAPIKIADAVWIGANCRICKGVSIGEGAVVASNSVVTKDVPPYTIVAGNPAKPVKQLDAPTESVDAIAERVIAELAASRRNDN